MKVLVNAVSIKEGGSRVVLLRLLEAMAAGRPDIEWHAAVHPSIARERILPDAVTLWTSAGIDQSPAHVIYWYEVALPRLVRRLGADVLFSQTNYLPRRGVACPTLLLEQHAGHFSAEFGQLMERELASRWSVTAWRRKTAWVENSVRTADRVIVQTAALAEAIGARIPASADRIDVVAHGPGLVVHADRPTPWPEGRPWRIGYVSKYGVQKDFAAALQALRELRSRGRDATLVLTLDQAQPGAAMVQGLAAEFGVAKYVENHGELGIAGIQALYDGLDAFTFPSRCESFGFPLVEAMARGVPVVVARTPSNVEVAGDGAPAFAPGDWRGLADAVESVLADAASHRTQALRSLSIAHRYSWDRAAADTLGAIARVSAR